MVLINSQQYHQWIHHSIHTEKKDIQESQCIWAQEFDQGSLSRGALGGAFSVIIRLELERVYPEKLGNLKGDSVRRGFEVGLDHQQRLI